MSHNQSKKHETALKLALDALGVKDGILITFDQPSQLGDMTQQLSQKLERNAAGALIRFGRQLARDSGAYITDQDLAKSLLRFGITIYGPGEEPSNNDGAVTLWNTPPA